MRRLICIGTLAAILLTGCGPRNARPHGPQAITLATEDGQELSALLYATTPKEGTARPPGLVLIHRPGGESAVWDTFALWLQQRGYLVVVPNLKQDVAHWDRVLAGLKAAKGALLDAGADPANLAAAGEGGGSSLAFEYALGDRDMQGVIALSPEAGAAGFKAREQMALLKELPLLLMASESDPHGAALAKALQQAAPGFCELRTFTTSAYGADLLTDVPNARDQALLWLQSVLPEGPGKESPR